LRKNIGPLLIEQGGNMSGCFRLFVDRARFFAFLDYAAYGTVADLDGHVINRSILGRRKRIHRLDWIGCGVFEDLRECNSREKSADRAAHVGVLQRTRARDFPIFGDNFK
jgi:hypothetical protein